MCDQSLRDHMKRLRTEIDSAVKEALAHNDHARAMAVTDLATARVQEIRRACEELLSHISIQNELIANSR